MLRLVTPLLVVLATVIAAPAFATGKGPGAYTNMVVRDAEACARACADDGLCMAWSFYSSGACELTATVPANAPEGSASFGLAARAPTFASRQPAPTPAVAQVAAPQPAPAAQEPEAPTVIAAAEIDADLVLLGGPEEGDLRARLGERR